MPWKIRLGVQLFVRAPRKLHLTPAGLRLLKEARKVFIRIERAHRAVRETDARFRAPLRIGVADGIAQPRLSECLVRWREMQRGRTTKTNQQSLHVLVAGVWAGR